MPDEFDVRDDREEAREEGGDDEVGLAAIKLAASTLQSPRLLRPGMNQCWSDIALITGRNCCDEAKSG